MTLRVLHVVRGLTNSSGTTHIVVPLAEEQARQGSQVSVYFVDQGPHEAVLPDARLVESRCFAQSLPGSNPGISLEFARAVGSGIRRFDIVHIHAIWNFPTFWTMRSARAAGVPYVVAPQGSFEPWALAQSAAKKRIVGSWTEVPLINRAAAVQAVTETEAAQLRGSGILAPVAVVPNGVDASLLDRRAPHASAPLGLPRGTQVLLSLSRLHPKKGIDALLTAFALVRAALPDVTLVIAGGDGGSGYGAQLRSLAQSLGLGERCVFAGEVRGDAKLDLMAGSDAFVLASHSEGLPVAALEAMAAGLPVILTPGCNLPEVQAAGAGLIVAPTPERLANAFTLVFADPAARTHMSAHGRQLVARTFTWPQIATETLALYGRLTAQRLSGTG